jgi:murein DD-endopeptidase MepM/ murein hydrolase activator NlpD
VKGFKNQFKYIKRLIILICALCITGTSTVSALSKEQLNALDSGALWVNTEVATTCGGDSNVSLRGDNNEAQVLNFFVDHGLKPFQAAAIAGNMKHESGIEPQRLQGVFDHLVPAESLSSGQLNDTQLGWGTVQFTPPKKIVENVKPRKKANQLSAQLDFIWDQLQLKGQYPEPQVLKDIRSTTNIRDAVLAFQGNKLVGGKYTGYERPGDQSGTVSRRVGFATDILSKYGSGAGSADASSSDEKGCTTDLSGEVNGEFSLPVAKKIYTQHPDWFSAPHHDYPAADIRVPSNTRVFSMTAGKVLLAPVGGSCGVGILIDAGQGNQFLYCHGTDGGSVANAKQGDTVEPGQLIMHSDNTGHTSGPHLHVQIRVDGQNRCPQTLFKGIAEGNVPDLQSLPSSGCTN